MLTFKEYLIEENRTKARVHKLINYLANRHSKDKDEIPFKHYEYTGVATPLHKEDKHMFDFAGEKRMAMKDLSPGQPFFSHTGLKHYADDFEYNYRNPIVAVHYPDRNVTVIHDGHHRYLSNKLRRVTHDNVKLYVANDKYKEDF